MPERAQVTSVEAVDDFRSRLIVYLSKARPTLEEISADVMRIRLWLENDQRAHWEHEVRRRAKQLEQAQQAVFSARMSNLRQTSDAEQMAVHRARRALDEAEAKLRRVKQWSRDFDSRVEPLAKQLDHLRDLLATEMGKAVAHLAEIIKILAQYAEFSPSDSTLAALPSSAPGAANGGDGSAHAQAGSVPGSAPAPRTREGSS